MKTRYFALIVCLLSQGVMGTEPKPILNLTSKDGQSFEIPLQQIRKSLRKTSDQNANGYLRYSFVEPQLDGSIIFFKPEVYFQGQWISVRLITPVDQFCEKMQLSHEGEVEYWQPREVHQWPSVKINLRQEKSSGKVEFDDIGHLERGKPFVRSIKCRYTEKATAHRPFDG